MTLFTKWIAARWQWAWCALFGHPLTEPRSCHRNNRHGQVASTDRWLSCECGARVGIVTRQRFIAPY